jgi:hypothetical protein
MLPLVVGLGVGAAALWFMTRKEEPKTEPGRYEVPRAPVDLQLPGENTGLRMVYELIVAE